MIDETLDLTGVPCPANAARALIKIATMLSGEKIELILDAGEPVENVPAALELEGHFIRTKNAINELSWSLIVEVG